MILPPTSESIAFAAGVIVRGELVAFPTETVYGLGANALDADAVARIFEKKGRPRFDPLIVHVVETAMLQGLVERVPDAARALAARFWPGPLTLVLERSPRVPDIVTAGRPTVAVRIPDHPIALRLIAQAATPIAAPSANRFGSVSPTTAEHVEEQLQDVVILDGGPCAVGVESTVLSLAGDRPLLLRAGGLPREWIESVIGEVAVPPPGSHFAASPGRAGRHYATRTPLFLGDEPAARKVGPRVGLLALSPPADPERWAAVEVLSSKGDLTEAAARLFAAMRRLDQAGLDAIVAERCEPEGLGLAILDRLERASLREAP